jgi:hypothetical protein
MEWKYAVSWWNRTNKSRNYVSYLLLSFAESSFHAYL